MSIDAIESVWNDDEGVSPVIAVILMVAITVVLAATVYVWVSGFATEDTGPEQASATAEGTAVGGNDVNWVRVTLTKGQNAPYDEKAVNYTLLDPNGNSFSANFNNATDDYFCTQAQGATQAWATGVTCDGVDFHDGSPFDSNEWDAGQTLYMPCQASGEHSVTISIKGTTVLDSSVECDSSA